MSIHAFAYAYVDADIKHSIEMPKKNRRWRFCFDCFFFSSLLHSPSPHSLTHSFVWILGAILRISLILTMFHSFVVAFSTCAIYHSHSLRWHQMTIFLFFSASLTSSRIAVTYSRHTRSLSFTFFPVILWFDLVSLISYPITNKLVHLFSVPCICSPTVQHSRYLLLFEHKINVVGQFQL